MASSLRMFSDACCSQDKHSGLFSTNHRSCHSVRHIKSNSISMLMSNKYKGGQIEYKKFFKIFMNILALNLFHLIGPP